ncbi:MAG: hypothetical protein LBR29_07605, partial [Methylobacteriaceae bacterium]|nr:hypothetical protein [Methylobacteriaceae bacterium]
RFVLNGEIYGGTISAETAYWLISSLEVGELTDTAVSILREAVNRADVVDPVLMDFVLKHVRRMPRYRYGNSYAA